MVYHIPMEYTVKQLANLAGISIRTLHFYDSIHLLKPARVAENGYRFYNTDDLFRLQQILLYREMDLDLERIRKILEDPSFDLVSALEQHKIALGSRIQRLFNLVETVEETISSLKGKTSMAEIALFQAFSEEEQEKYAKEAEELYDPETVRASNRKWKEYSAEKKASILSEGGQIYLDIVQTIPKGAGSPEVQECVSRWRTHMDYFWTPTPEQLNGLAEMYVDHPEFRKNFDKIDPRLAEFMRAAVAIYVKSL